MSKDKMLDIIENIKEKLRDDDYKKLIEELGNIPTSELWEVTFIVPINTSKIYGKQCFDCTNMIYILDEELDDDDFEKCECLKPKGINKYHKFSEIKHMTFIIPESFIRENYLKKLNNNEKIIVNPPHFFTKPNKFIEEIIDNSKFEDIYADIFTDMTSEIRSVSIIGTKMK